MTHGSINKYFIQFISFYKGMISHLDLDEYENTFICVDGECQEE